MATTSFEVEVKIAIKDPKKIEGVLIEMGSVKTNRETQVDTYFNHPCRSFETTDEALRLRTREKIAISNQAGNIPATKIELTYKGPKLDTTTKTRLELSVGIRDTESIRAILIQLGFQEVATIVKDRIFFALEGMIASIDHVDKVGSFLEVETVVDSEDRIPSAREEILSFVEKIGLRRTDSIRESYLELFLRKLHS
ncbi:MAG: class IV adenylate cyclase [Candidatus Thorarchaeota archaeon]